MSSNSSKPKSIPTLNLREVPFEVYRKWLRGADQSALHLESEIEERAKEYESNRFLSGNGIYGHILDAYEAALDWDRAAVTQEMIFYATYLKCGTQLCKEIDVFTAIFRVQLDDVVDARMPPLGSCVKACKYAWLQDWNRERFEYQLFCHDVRGLAKKWNATVLPASVPVDPQHLVPIHGSTYRRNRAA